MNYSELVKKVTDDNLVDAPKKVVKEVLDTMVATVVVEVASGGDVVIPGVGKFSRVERAERVGRNPQTGEPVTIPARYAPRFKPAKAFKDYVNE